MSSAAPADFRAFFDRLRQGDNEAARQLVDEYGPAIMTVIRRKLNPTIRSKYDSNDFLQNVWREFFDRAVREQTFETAEQLMAFLVTLARNLVLGTVRQRLDRQKCDVRREESLEVVAASRKRHPADRASGPLLLVLAQDEWEHLLRDQPDHHRRILVLLRQGYTHLDVARELRINERTVRRVVAVVRWRMQQRPG